ncbi:MAG TPA: hypothetical protein VGM56_31810 [Byssovorax sp.]|jgi:predicted methyltransferase
MSQRTLTLVGAAFTLVACASEPAPEPAAPPPPPPPVETVAATPPPPELTVAQKKAAADAKELADDRAKWEASEKIESARWTPDLHAKAKALADKSYPSGDAALKAALAGPQRRPADVARDAYRHPRETMEFFGFKPTMTVVDVGPGEGWYTEILAPALAAKGRYVATNTDPNGPADKRPTFYGQRFKAFLEHAPEAYGKVQTIVIDSKAPKLGLDGTADMVLIMRGVHGMKNNGLYGAWLAEISKALKPGGVLGIVEHRAAAGADPTASAKKGYLPEAWVIAETEAAGFKLAGKSEINANPKDTKDYSEGVWALPPTYRNGDKDHDKYAAIGESDRMTLKFVKVAPAKKK